MQISGSNIKRMFAAVTAGLFLAAGCSDADTTESDQRAAFEKYLSGLGIPYTEQNGAFRYVVNADREGYEEAAEAAWGDSVKFGFALMEFQSRPSELIFTNIESLVAGDTVLNPQYWSFAPLGVKLGSTPLMEGLSYALQGGRQGDSVVVLLTSEAAFGDKPVGIVPADTPVVWSVIINEVVKP